jgi:hypothetical protein
MLQWLYTYVSSVCSKCFILFSRRMFASVSSECCICFHTYIKCFQVFFSSVSYACFELFRTYVASVLSGCFKSRSSIAVNVFRCIFHVFYLLSDVCCKCCIQMLQKQIGCCISVLTFLLPHLRLGVSSSSQRQLGIRRLFPSSRCWRSHLL